MLASQLSNAYRGEQQAHAAREVKRERDVVASLPRVPRGLRARGATEGKDQESFDLRVRLRFNRAVGVLRGLWKGRLDLAEVSGEGPTPTAEWGQASPSQRRIVRELAMELADQEHNPCGLSDVECFSKITGGATQAYPEVVKTPSGVNKGLDRGAMCPAVAEQVSVPPSSNRPIHPQRHSARVRAYYDRAEETMLKKDAEVDWESHARTKSYMAPGFRARANRLALYLRLAAAGMLQSCSEVAEEVSVFTVVKKVSDAGEVISRLVWALRRCNH